MTRVSRPIVFSARSKTVDASAGAEPLYRAARAADRRPIRVRLDCTVAELCRYGRDFGLPAQTDCEEVRRLMNV
jgi:hypothetical protein